MSFRSLRVLFRFGFVKLIATLREKKFRELKEKSIEQNINELSSTE